MQKSHAVLLATLAIVALSAPAAQADVQLLPFSYRVKLPAGNASCAEHATAVASAFAAGTRANKVTGVCESRQTLVDQGHQYPVDVVVVNYLSPAEQAPFRSVFGGNAFLGKGDATAGVFATYADCLGQLSAQQAIFLGETGQTPLAAYCTASSQQQFYPGFSLTFESFGDLKHRLYTFAEDGVDTGEDHTQITQAAVTAITSAGGHVVWSDSNRAFYYNSGYISIGSENLGMFSVATQCTSQLAQVQAIFTAAGWVGITAYCHDYPPAAGLSYSVLMVVGAGQDEVQDTTSDLYGTFEECTNDLNRILQNAASGGRHVYGGLCSPNNSGHTGFDAHVFYSLQ